MWKFGSKSGGFAAIGKMCNLTSLQSSTYRLREEGFGEPIEDLNDKLILEKEMMENKMAGSGIFMKNF